MGPSSAKVSQATCVQPRLAGGGVGAKDGLQKSGLKLVGCCTGCEQDHHCIILRLAVAQRPQFLNTMSRDDDGRVTSILFCAKILFQDLRTRDIPHSWEDKRMRKTSPQLLCRLPCTSCSRRINTILLARQSTVFQCDEGSPLKVPVRERGTFRGRGKGPLGDWKRSPASEEPCDSRIM